MNEDVPLYIACSIYLATGALGASVQYGRLRLGRWRFLHHWLFAATWLTLIGAMGLGWWLATDWWWRLSIIIPPLALFPRYRASTIKHRVLALSGLIGWMIVLGSVYWQ